MHSYKIRTATGETILLRDAKGDFNEGEAVRVNHQGWTLEGTVTKKFNWRNRPAGQRRGR